MGQIKGIPVAPLTGILDTRSSPDLLPQGALRMRQNWNTVGDGKLRRGCGWTKLLNRTQYNNQDFHDQLLLFGGSTREPITLLMESQSSRGIRTLWLATQSRIARLNEITGNWKIIGSGMGGGPGTDCSGHRFKAANVGDYVIFTNDYDPPKVHRLEQPPFDNVLLADIPDLATIGLTKAALVWAWKDVVFLADVEMDGERLSNRIVWGDYKNPTSFDPSKPESISGYKDLNYGERILNGGPTTAGTYLVYTTHAIWEISVVGGLQVFSWREAYPGHKSDFVGLLKYENTLLDFGGDHLYMAKDGIYLYNPYRSAPELATWLHRGSSPLYDDIDSSACGAHIGFFHDGEAFFSVKRNSDVGCPGITLRLETLWKVADIIDHGFTAATNFRSQEIPTIRDFMLDKRICTLPGLASSFAAYGISPPFEKEGLPSPFSEPSVPLGSEPTVFYTHSEQTISGVVTEDWNQASAAADSLCAILGEALIDSLCLGCESVSKLVVASAQDWCLKEYDKNIFYRERCANPAAVGSLSYDVQPTNVGVDFVFVVDESGSMADAHTILSAVAAGLETSLNAAGIGNGTIANRYASIAFGNGDPAQEELPFQASAAFAAATAGIGLVGSGTLQEDAYEGIAFAINGMAWRTISAVAKVIFFITDEDRQSTNFGPPDSGVHIYNIGADQAAQFASLKASLIAGGYVLAGMFDESDNGFKDSNHVAAIAGDSTGKCYLPDGAGGYTLSTGTPVMAVNVFYWGDSPSFPLTGSLEEYYALVMDPATAGYYYDLRKFRLGGATKTSVLAVIVPSLAARIQLELTTLLYVSSVGSYVLDGYDSILRFATLFADQAMICVERFALKGTPAAQSQPSSLILRVGISGQTADPNVDRCVIVWKECTPKLLKCISGRTAAEHAAAKTVPSQDIAWRFFHKGKNVFIELKVEGTGGDCILSGVVADAKTSIVKNF